MYTTCFLNLMKENASMLPDRSCSKLNSAWPQCLGNQLQNQQQHCPACKERISLEEKSGSVCIPWSLAYFSAQYFSNLDRSVLYLSCVLANKDSLLFFKTDLSILMSVQNSVLYTVHYRQLPASCLVNRLFLDGEWLSDHYNSCPLFL